MKKSIILIFLLTCALGGAARQLSPSQALSRVTGGGVRTMSLNTASAQPAMTVADNGFTSLYVFDKGPSGFMIVSADDCAVPLLGYSDSDSFDPGAIPPQLAEWLDFYAAEIKSAASAQGASASATSAQRPYRAPIAPMTQSKWNQGAPYNDDCPLDNGKRSVTGCVATAMAQMMYYYKWPETGRGSKSYKWEVGDSVLSVNFADITFDWADMTDTYNKESTEAQKAAVAELMYACGVSVHMHFTSGESGAASLDMGPALNEYFDYAPDMASPQRYFYGLIDWENLIYDQLSRGWPVLYNGQGSEGGHQFICDGYSSDGYFHFNWGWGGLSDGYYLLSALDPMEQGIGGNLTGFNYEQGIWINVRPDSPDSTYTVTPYIYGYGNFGTTATAPVALGDEVTFEASKDFINFTNSALTGYMGIAIEAADSSVTYVAHAEPIDLRFYGATRSFSVKLPDDLAPGTYTVTPAFKMESSGLWTPILCSLSGVQALKMTVADSKASFSSFEPASVEITSLTQNTPFYFGTKFSVTVDFLNPGTQEYFGEIMLALVDSDGKRVDNALMSEALNLPGGQSASVDIVSDFPAVVNKTDSVAAGDYYLQVYEYMTGNVLYTSPSTVPIAQAPATTSIRIDDVVVDSEKDLSTGKTAVQFSGTATCTEGYFAGQLQVRVYKAATDNSRAKAKTDYIFIDPGEQSTFTATVDLDADDGSEFYAEIYWNDNLVSTEKYYFTIDKEGFDGVDDESLSDGSVCIVPRPGFVEIDSSYPIASAEIYAVSGLCLVHESYSGDTSVTIPVSNLLPGLYIVVAHDAAGRAAFLRFVAD